MLRPLWTFLLVLKHLWRQSAWQTPEETTFETDYSDLLVEQLPKTESESTADDRTDYKWRRKATLLLKVTLTGSMSLSACSTC